ncbi:conserved hypothetical protein [uncultured Eubacteriales bacterium]|uniref:Uncharacterized protein n=1 Tax=uncultured Eubacteriales bacterium TaxID=172733 RepID=A0A212J8F3_9FIRM|nr:conserved hypothetical protein [uncultured Eubacteriales bacterium]
MRYGYFDDRAREYVITTPETPLPWINYLGSQDFFSLISNTGGGYSFYRDAKLLRLTRYRYNTPPDGGGHYFYIKDGTDIWNPGWQPVRAPLERYACHHGLGYTAIEGARGGLSARQEVFVPLGDPCEVTRLTLRNETGAVKSFQVFSALEFCLWNAVDDAANFQRNYSTGEVEVEDGVVYHKTEYRERRNHYAFFRSNCPPDGFDTSRDAFCGPYRGFGDPAAVERGACSGSIAHGWSPIAALQFDLTLEPGEERDLIFVLGYAENLPEEKWSAPGIINKAPVLAITSRYETAAQVDAALAALRAHWDELLGIYSLDCADHKLRRMVDIWHQYQCMVTFNLSRSASSFESGTGRGMGFRDSCQDLLGCVHLIPERAKERILDIAATQLPDGGAYHQYQPLTKRGNNDIGGGFNDDPLWLVACVCAYLRETGDFAILEEAVPFDNDPDSSAPLMEHLRRSVGYTMERMGPHGLPLIGRADWNDCLNLNCFSTEPGESFQTVENRSGGKAESVLIAGMFVKYAAEYADLCARMGLAEEAGKVRASIERIEAAVLDAGWDGAWFRRAYDFFGNPVGSKSCDEGQIYIEPQGMCVMAGIGIDDGRAALALKSVEERLDTEYGVVVHQPAYTTYHPELGEISSYPPGYKENAGIFCHVNPWISIAETTVGHGVRAFEVYRKTCPAYLHDVSDLHRTEPYVYSQMVAGKDAPTFGEAKNSWLTGTAAWAFVNVSQFLLGVRPEMDGLRVDPCMGGNLNAFTVTRKFRGATYRITVQNPDGVERGVRSLTVDGVSMEGNLIPLAPAGAEVSVTAVMG